MRVHTYTHAHHDHICVCHNHYSPFVVQNLYWECNVSKHPGICLLMFLTGKFWKLNLTIRWQEDGATRITNDSTKNLCASCRKWVVLSCPCFPHVVQQISFIQWIVNEAFPFRYRGSIMWLALHSVGAGLHPLLWFLTFQTFSRGDIISITNKVDAITLVWKDSKELP